MKKAVLLVIALLALIIWVVLRSQNASPSAITSPSPSTQKLDITGSDTEVQLVSQLAEGFRSTHPDADISVTGGGSGVGIAALINGQAEMINSSRPMKNEEWLQATSSGRSAQEFRLARDVVTIIVHPQNQVVSLTLDQLGKIYRGEIKNWQEVGGAKSPIVLYGRQSTSGTFSYFRDTVLKADYDPNMRSMEGNQSIVDAVRSDPNGIGYVGVGYARGADGEPAMDIKVLALDDVSPLDGAALTAGKYALSRPLYQYLSALPEKDSLTDQFLRFEASTEGQAEVERAGSYPLFSEDVKHNQVLFDAIH